MMESRYCHICSNGPLAYGEPCERCTIMIDLLLPPALLTPDQRVAEMGMWRGPLEVPFHKMHERIEALVGRDVAIHEFLDWESLVEEARNNTGVSALDTAEVIRQSLDRLPSRIQNSTFVYDVGEGTVVPAEKYFYPLDDGIEEFLGHLEEE
jgi:hypothetical protein